MDILNKRLLTTIHALLLLSFLFAAGSLSLQASSGATQKQKVIAGAIYKFIKFVEWEQEIVEARPSFNLCLLQYDAAFEAFKKRQFQGKAIKVLIFKEKVQACDALYLNASLNHDEALQRFKDQPVLTISERQGFAASGGIIELGNHNNRLTFSINQASAKAKRLNIAFQLLSLARKVIEK